MDFNDELDRLEGKMTAHANILAELLHRLDLGHVPAKLSEDADAIEAANLDEAHFIAPLHHYRQELATISVRLRQLAGPRPGS